MVSKTGRPFFREIRVWSHAISRINGFGPAYLLIIITILTDAGLPDPMASFTHRGQVIEPRIHD